MHSALSSPSSSSSTSPFVPPPPLPSLSLSCRFRRLVPQGHPSLNPTTPWSLPPPSPPSSPLYPSTAPPGYAAWAWMTVTMTMTRPGAERYFGDEGRVINFPTRAGMGSHPLPLEFPSSPVRRSRSFLPQPLHPLRIIRPLTENHASTDTHTHTNSVSSFTYSHPSHTHSCAFYCSFS